MWEEEDHWAFKKHLTSVDLKVLYKGDLCPYSHCANKEAVVQGGKMICPFSKIWSVRFDQRKLLGPISPKYFHSSRPTPPPPPSDPVWEKSVPSLYQNPTRALLLAIYRDTKAVALPTRFQTLICGRSWLFNLQLFCKNLILQSVESLVPFKLESEAAEDP